MDNVKLSVVDIFDEIRIGDYKYKESSIIDHIKSDTWYSVSFSL
jgi:hypothetical protein